MCERSRSWNAVLLATLALWTSTAIADATPDPTRPPARFGSATADDAPEDAERLALQAVFRTADRQVAIVNDRRVGVGDVVSSARVVSIEGDRVTLRRRGRTIELELVPADVKRPLPPKSVADHDERNERVERNERDHAAPAAPDGVGNDADAPAAPDEGIES